MAKNWYFLKNFTYEMDDHLGIYRCLIPSCLDHFRINIKQVAPKLYFVHYSTGAH